MPVERNDALDELRLANDDRSWLGDLANLAALRRKKAFVSHAPVRVALEAQKLRGRHAETIGRYRTDEGSARRAMDDFDGACSLDNEWMAALKVLRLGFNEQRLRTRLH